MYEYESLFQVQTQRRRKFLFILRLVQQTCKSTVRTQFQNQTPSQTEPALTLLYIPIYSIISHPIPSHSIPFHSILLLKIQVPKAVYLLSEKKKKKKRKKRKSVVGQAPTTIISPRLLRATSIHLYLRSRGALAWLVGVGSTVKSRLDFSHRPDRRPRDGGFPSLIVISTYLKLPSKVRVPVCPHRSPIKSITYPEATTSLFAAVVIPRVRFHSDAREEMQSPLNFALLPNRVHPNCVQSRLKQS